MPDSKAKREWVKENTIFVGIKLNKNTDADIINYLDGKSKQTEIKRIIRKEIGGN